MTAHLRAALAHLRAGLAPETKNER
jgi:hypothetical protein